MKIENISIEKIRPYPQNAKIHNTDQINAVAKSIELFGIKQPLVLDKDYVIIIGHCRYEAAKKLNIAELPCIISTLTPAQERALRIIDNRTNESEWITESLNEELKDLEDIFDFTELGFSIADIIALDDNFKPEDLDFEGEDVFVENANEQLKARQMSISYNTEEEEEWLKAKMRLDTMKVVIYAKDINR